MKVKVKPIVESKGVSYAPEDWLKAWQRSCSRDQPREEGRLSQPTIVKRAQASISARQEEAFQSWWRESRSQSLRPREQSGPTPAQRIEALRRRIASKVSVGAG